MIKEDYVSFETAKLLKEKGFNEECYIAYFNGKLVDYTMFGFCMGELMNAPTLQMAMKWLREKHNIFIEISVDEALNEYGYQWALFDNTTKSIRPYAGWGDTYEQSCEEAIQYALKNILTFENVKIEMNDVAGKDSIMPKVILNDFIRKKKENTMTSYRTNEEIIKEFCNENLTTHTDHFGTWVETKNICGSVDEFVKKLMQHIEDNHGKC